jgi:hypothetical protein
MAFIRLKEEIKEKLTGSWRWTKGSFQSGFLLPDTDSADSCADANTGPVRKELTEEEDVIILQVGQKAWGNVTRSLRQELWLSALQRAGGLGTSMPDKYEEYLNMVSLSAAAVAN